MADNKSTATTPSKAQPPAPPEARKRPTDDTAAAPATRPASVPPPVPGAAPVPTPAVFTPPPAEAQEMSVEQLKMQLNSSYGKAAVERPPTELELAIEKVRELIKERQDGDPCPADKMTADQKRAMFQVIFDIEAKITAAKNVIEAEGVKRTWAVLNLVSTYGGKTGKWTVNGVGLKARARGDSWFLQRPDQDEGEVL